MQEEWKPKLGDRFFRPQRLSYHKLRRRLGLPGLFSLGYGNVGSSVYYGLGVVALAALGFTPIALIIAGIIYIFNSLSYAEGSATIPEGGGSASFARVAFNDAVGFISGWSLMLSYIATIAISSYTIPPYLSHFWPILKEPFANTITSIGIIAFLMILNIIGIRESSRVNIFFTAVDILTQIALIILGIAFIIIVNPANLINHMFGEGNVPSTRNFILGIALAALCFTGVETVSQLAEETKRPTQRIPRAYVLMIFAVLIILVGISVVALGSMTPQLLADPVNGWARDPIAGIAANLPFDIMRDLFEPLVAILAATILLTATNAGLIGVSRLAFSMSRHKQVPAVLASVHQKFRTPYISIFVFCCISFVLLIPGFFNPGFFVDLGGIYIFGSLLCFALAHMAIIGLRILRPELPRPFRIGWNISIKGKEVPVTAILGLLATIIIWILIVIINPFSRYAGLIWMAIGFIIFIIFRLKNKLPVFGAVNEKIEKK